MAQLTDYMRHGDTMSFGLCLINPRAILAQNSQSLAECNAQASAAKLQGRVSGLSAQVVLRVASGATKPGVDLCPSLQSSGTTTMLGSCPSRGPAWPVGGILCHKVVEHLTLGIAVLAIWVGDRDERELIGSHALGSDCAVVNRRDPPAFVAAVVG